MALQDRFRNELDPLLRDAHDNDDDCRAVLNCFFAIARDPAFAAAPKQNTNPMPPLAGELATVLNAVFGRNVDTSRIPLKLLYGCIYGKFKVNGSDCMLVYSQNENKGAIAIPLADNLAAYKVFPAFGTMETVKRLYGNIRRFSDA